MGVEDSGAAVLGVVGVLSEVDVVAGLAALVCWQTAGRVQAWPQVHWGLASLVQVVALLKQRCPVSLHALQNVSPLALESVSPRGLCAASH